MAPPRFPRFFPGMRPANVLAMESGCAVQEWTRRGLGVVKPVFYARLSPWSIPAAMPAASELRLDVQPLPGSGAEVIHREPVGGEFQGRRFDSVRHRATLTLVRADGIEPAGTGSLAPRHPGH